MASPTQRTWVWVNSRSWWRTGRPDVLQFMGSQRIRRDWAAELNWYVLHLHLFIDWWTFGCLYVLAIVNSATVNFGVHVSFQIRVFSGWMLQSEIFGSLGSSIFSFQPLFFLVAEPIYIPSNSVGWFPFLYILSRMPFCRWCHFLWIKKNIFSHDT